MSSVHSFPEDANILHQFAANLAAEAEQTQLLRKLQRAERHHTELNKELEQAQQRLTQLRDERDMLLDRVYELEVATLEFSSGSSDEEDAPPPGKTPSLGTKTKRVPKRQHYEEEESDEEELDMANAFDQDPALGGNAAGTGKRVKAPLTRTPTHTHDHKKKRVVKTAEAAAATPRRVVAFATDDQGQPILPLTVGVVTLHSAGCIVADRPAFHNKRYIWPAGYHSSRPYMSAIDPEAQTVYHNRIMDGGIGPLFDVYSEDHPEQHFQAPTPTGAWTAIVKAVNAVRGREYVNSASGPDFFGLSNSTISMIIESLPGAAQCTQYQRKVYEAAPSKAAAVTVAKVSSSAAMTTPSTDNVQDTDDDRDPDQDQDREEDDLILDTADDHEDTCAEVNVA